MKQPIIVTSDGHRVEGCGPDVELVNQFLHLGSRAFSPATVRAYAYDLLNFLRFLAERRAPAGRCGGDRPVRLPGLAAAPGGGRGRRWCGWPNGAARRRRR